MTLRLHPWPLFGIVVVACSLLVGGAVLLRSLRAPSPDELVEYLPSPESVLLFIDVQTLRSSGLLDLLAGSKLAEEPEYRTFVEQTGFDYREDLDAVLVSFYPRQTFFLLRGRFEWPLVKSFAVQQGGECRNTVCTVTGSQPERHISFFPLRGNLMAMAVSTNPWAARELNRRSGNFPDSGPLPTQPVWLSVPASALQNPGTLPESTRSFVSAMKGAERLTLSLGSQAGRFEAALDLVCRTPDEAAQITAQLEGITRGLRDLIAQQKQKPDPGDLTGVLTAGSFRQDGRTVHGRWPIEKAFLEAVAGGAL